MTLAFGDDEEERFADDDWAHALGGVHVVLDLDGEIVAHAAVVERELRVADRPLRTGYVEAVATTPDRQGQGLGSLVMGEVNAIIRDGFELGALGTGSQGFYERLGWLTWQGPTFVRTAEGPEAHAGRGRRDHGARHAELATAGPRGAAQLRVARRRRLVGTCPTRPSLSGRRRPRPRASTAGA